MTSLVTSLIAEASPVSYWLDSPDRPEPVSALEGATRADLLVIGGGYTGLWAALLAKEADPGRDVVLLEATACGDAASGRNGGFCAASLTHGLGNGADRCPDDLGRLEALGRANLLGIERTLERYDIDCGWERTGELDVAVGPWQLEGVAQTARLAQETGGDAVLLDREALQAEVHSPTYLGGVWLRDAVAMVDPARLVWGLRAACLRVGVRVYEGSPASGLARAGTGVSVRTPAGSVTARRVLLATNAFPSLLRRLRLYTVPVYDYALMTEPLTPEQRSSLGWRHRQGIGDGGNLFHYYRLTQDDRLLFGGYDAVYPYAGRVDPRHDSSPVTSALLAQHLLDTFPQLEGVRFSHAWGGAIDTCTRFFPFVGASLGGRVSYALGYTGLGVGASRFAAAAALDLLDGRETERTSTPLVTSKPLPFPPEPLRWAGISLTRRSLARADARGGHRDLWLRAMDRLGLGFDS